MGDDLEAEILEFLQRKYVQRADDRQRAMGLSYTTAETKDLAREIALFVAPKIDAHRRNITHYGLFRSQVPNSPMIKDAEFFCEQGGLSKDWGSAWEPIEDCATIGEARRKIAAKYSVELSPIYRGES